MFVQASRLKLRFETPKGQLSVEDLWDLPLTSQRGVNLDTIAQELHGLQSQQSVSFVFKDKPKNEIDKLRFEIVLHIINTRLAEAEVAASARAKSEQKQKLLEIIARKEDTALEGTSLEDLRKMVESL